MFSIVKNGEMNIGELFYVIKENAFDFKPSLSCDVSLLIGYLNLGLDSNTMSIKQVWGFCPKAKWINKTLVIPNYEKGEILLDGEIESGITKRLIDTGVWQVSYDQLTGWICIGDEKYYEKSIAIQFATNTVAVIHQREIYSLWLKPDFIK